MNFLYNYLRNIINYGLTSEHLILNNDNADLYVIKCNHLLATRQIEMGPNVWPMTPFSPDGSIMPNNSKGILENLGEL